MLLVWERVTFVVLRPRVSSVSADNTTKIVCSSMATCLPRSIGAMILYVCVCVCGGGRVCVCVCVCACVHACVCACGIV